MRNIIYVAPFPMATTIKFAKAISELQNVRLFGVFQVQPSLETKKLFYQTVTVQNALSVDHLDSVVRSLIGKYGRIHKLLGILENVQEQLGVLRDRYKIPGMSAEGARQFREKGIMKEVLRKNGVPCARYRRIKDLSSALQFIDEVGFPIVLKPPSGAGCRSTIRVSNFEELMDALQEIKIRPILAEEFLTGIEHSMEAFTVNGVPRFCSFSRYYPSPLEVMQTPWIQWVVLFPNELDDPIYQQAKKVGIAAIRALGLQEGMTHMEWFRRPDGSVAVGEIGARPPGAQISSVTGLIHGMNVYRTWARIMVDGVWDGPYTRKSAAAIAFLRGNGQGRIVSIQGLSEAQKKMGDLVVDVKLPRVGAMKSSGYEGDGWVVIQHPDTERVKHAALELITTVKIKYQY